MMVVRSMRNAVWAVCVALLAVALGLAVPASAQQQLVLACYGGGIERYMRDYVIPGFEREYNARVVYLAGKSSDTLARLQAQRNNPQVDVVCLDDGPQAQAISFGLLAKNDPNVVTHLRDLYDFAKNPHDIGAAWGVLTLGLVYNEEALARRGIEPPRSWNDLLRPEFAGHVAVDSISTTYGLHLLIMLARANGGGEHDIEPGFVKMKQLAPSVIDFGTTADVSPYFLQEDAWVGVWTNMEANAFVAHSGFPMRFVYPDEGGPAVMATVSVVAGAPNPGLAQQFVNYMLSPQVQYTIATELFFGPVNRTVVVPADIAEKITYGEEAVAKVINVDWDLINQHRAAWTDRWNKEIEGY